MHEGQRPNRSFVCAGVQRRMHRRMLCATRGPALAALVLSLLTVSACATAPPAAPGTASDAANGSDNGRALGFERVVSPFTVLDEHGEPYAMPFLGGLDVPRPQFIDIDGDGDLDLFIQERTDELMFLENVGSATAPRYEWRTDRYQDLAIGEWSRFVDVDRDGLVDLLAEQPYSYIRYYRNTGTATAPRFEIAADSLHDVQGEAVFSDRQNIAHAVDLDCDDQLDLFLGRVDGTITRYEQDGETNGVPVFRFVTDRFENIEIVGQLVGSARHGANSMFFADADDDGDLDLYWGDFFEPGLLFIENSGSCQNPLLRSTPRPVMADGDTIKTSGYNAPYLADIDDDGDLDLFIGVLGGAFNPNRTAAENFHFYERRDDGSYSLRTTRFANGIDAGGESIVAAGDLNGDGAPDLLVGNKIAPHDPNAGRLLLFTNTGSPTAPAFELADTLNVAPASYHPAPELADLDGDGDLDLLLGTWNQGVYYFRNEGSARAPRFVQDTTLTVELTRGSNSVPALVDIDGDSDLDLFVGESSGEINFFRNIGSASEPRFELVSDAYEGFDIGRRSAPSFIDLDGDGDYDLVVGREEGGVVFYRNDGSAQSPRFVESDAFALPLHALSSPVFVDLDGDGRLDLLSGTLSGGVTLWMNRGQ